MYVGNDILESAYEIAFDQTVERNARAAAEKLLVCRQSVVGELWFRKIHEDDPSKTAAPGAAAEYLSTNPSDNNFDIVTSFIKDHKDDALSYYGSLLQLCCYYNGEAAIRLMDSCECIDSFSEEKLRQSLTTAEAAASMYEVDMAETYLFKRLD